MAYLSMSGATLLRGVSTAARDAVSLGCCRWKLGHDVTDDGVNTCNRHVRLWHKCFPNASALETCNQYTVFAWPSDAMTAPLQLQRLVSLGVWCLSVDAAMALSSAIDMGTLSRLEYFGVGEISCGASAFDLGRSLAECAVLRSVFVTGGFTDASNIGAFLEGLSFTQSVTQLSLCETSISHLLDFSPRLPHLRTLALSCCWGDPGMDELGGGAALGEAEAFLEALCLLAPCTSLSHLVLDPDAVRVPLSSAILALPHLPSLLHVLALDGSAPLLLRPNIQVVADTHSLLNCAPRLEQLVVQRRRIHATATDQHGMVEPTLVCDVAVLSAVESASGTRSPLAQWAYAILPLEDAQAPRCLHRDLRYTKWDDNGFRFFERLVCMALMQGPPPHEASGGGLGGVREGSPE